MRIINFIFKSLFLKLTYKNQSPNLNFDIKKWTYDHLYIRLSFNYQDIDNN